MRLLFLALAASVSFASLAQQPRPKAKPVKIRKVKQKIKPAKTGATTSAAADTAAVLTFQRTPCYGFCPAYSMRVFADGRVRYVGVRNVPVEGPKELKLPAATVAAMRQEAQTADFAGFKERYSRGTTDVPSTIVGVRQPDGSLKTVTTEGGEPAALTNLITYLRNQLDPLAGLPETTDR